MNPWKSNYKSHQGNVGLGMAIAYYTSYAISVLLPLNDTQKYDLAIDKEGKILRVSVKTTQQKSISNKHYVVGLRNTGGSSGKSVIRKFNKTSCDILFILTKQGTIYEIPSADINVNTITLDHRFDKYIVTLQGTSTFQETENVEAG